MAYEVMEYDSFNSYPKQYVTDLNIIGDIQKVC